MGSQTLDIFRQGVWASLTGGWFYDPNQGIFCNAVHLYIWIFFLCGPFFTYLYSPTFGAWIVYVSATATIMTVLKAVNMGLHFVYDQSHMLSETSPNGTTKCKESSGDCNGIEMQILDNTQSAISENRMFERDITDSIASLDCGNNNNSTIDFKVDVHRKNSSGSNESSSLYTNEIVQASHESTKPKNETGAQPKVRKHENPSGNLGNEVIYLCPLKHAISEEATGGGGMIGDCASGGDHICDESKCKQTANSILNDPDLDTSSHWNAINMDPQMPMRHRRSARSGISDEIKRLTMSPKNTYNTSSTAIGDLHLYPTSSYGESDLEIENLDRRFFQQQCDHMQKAQSGTISTLHLTNFNNSKSYKRRHSNVCSKSANVTCVYGGVRRIKSVALDISHLQSSVSNLPSYPHSIEVIPERQVKNSTSGPHPMQSRLTRNTYLNFCSKMDGLAEVGNSLREEDYYHLPKPIAERNIFPEVDLPSTSGKGLKKMNKLGKKCSSVAESELCRPQTESTGSESEINGSSSPLLNESKFLDSNDTESNSQSQHDCPLRTQYKTEDSGCPSSDCEQTSEGSKDMLLSKDNISSNNMKSVTSLDFDRKLYSDDRMTNDSEQSKQQPAYKNSTKESKNLGAVPKVLKRFDEPAPQTRSISLKGGFHRSLSCDSSSEPSRGFNRDQMTNHIYKPNNNDQWLLQGGSKRSFRVSSARFPLVYTNDIAFGSRPGPSMLEDSLKITPILRSTESKGEDDLLEEQLEFSKTLESTSEVRHIEPDMPLSIPDFIQFQYQEQLSMRRPSEDTNLNTSDRQFSDPAYCDYWQPCSLSKAKSVPQKRCYKYRLKYFGTKELEISMDRLQLLAIFDRDLNWFHVVLSIVLSMTVCFLGSVTLNLGIYRDICAFIFCVVIASSQYSLLKSVQPDAASPVHGFNKTVAYSRPIYFCLFCGLLLGSHYTLAEIRNDDSGQYSAAVSLFGIKFVAQTVFEAMEYSISIILLAFPILFSLGLFPQFNTFCMYLLEQIDLHVFGGNAACNLSASILSVLKSILAVCILYGPIYGSLYEKKGTQHIFFSIFCAALISISYHLSRSTSDFSHIWTLITSNLLKYTEEEDDDDIDVDNEQKNETIRTKKNSTGSDQIAKVKEIEEAVDKGNVITKSASSIDTTEQVDPFIKKFQSTVNNRLKNDLVVCTLISLMFLSLHATTVFTVLQPNLNFVLLAIAIVVGFILHYLIPQMRKHLPWLCFAHPILKQREYGKFEVGEASQIMWFERLYIYVCFIEKNILYPLIFISTVTADSQTIVNKFGPPYGSLIVTICALKAVRTSYSDSTNQYLILIFCWLFFKIDFKFCSETFILDYFVVSIIFRKFCEFLLKVQFVVTYIAPWQITWGSAFHAFAQPFSVPHSAMLFLQATVSAILSTPLNPFLGSAIFLTSYVRPIKFWERDYNTRRIDHSNTRLSSQLEKDLGADDNNLNSIFYEHLTRSLQHYLCGDLLLGRWGNVNQGDCFVLASDYLNCLVHIIELGNGLCTFQMRGLEFRGTYCQQREVEAISEGVEEDRGCCCCSPGHLPHMLSVNAMFSTRWLAWQVVAAQYVLEGYSISENLATATLQLFEFRKVLITYYVKSIIYYVTQSNKLDEWLAPGPIQDALSSTLSRQFVDLDPIFNYNLDEDFDFRALGITRGSFCCVYLNWIQFCYAKRMVERNAKANTPPSPQPQGRKASEVCENQESTASSAGNTSKNSRGKAYSDDRSNSENGTSDAASNGSNGSPINKDSPLVSLCLALGLLARRSLATASHSSLSGVEFFLHGLHALFKGDFRITSPRDEWVFADMELLHGVVAPAVKMGLKLHQDHFSSPDEYLDETVLYDAIQSNSTQLVISHEADPMWRSAVLRGAPNLLALRHVMEDGCDEYRIIRLTKRFLSFRVIKLNRECVRGLWAGQQQELIYLRNRNPERGSIQNAKQALRNIINSSCDQPIGYPIYVSPLTTSYAETNEQFTQVIGGSLTLDSIQNLLITYWKRIRNRFQEGCSSGSSVVEADTTSSTCVSHAPGHPAQSGSMILTRSNQSFPGSTIRSGGLPSVNKPTNSALLVGFLNREREQDREAVRDRLSKRGAQLRNATELNNLSDGMPMLKDFGENPGISRQRQTSLPDEICSSIIMSTSSSSGKFTEAGEHNILNGLPESAEQLLVEINKKVIIVNQMEIYDCLDLGRRIDVVWPNEKMRLNGGRSSWKGWFPEEGMVGFVVHYWQPNHPDQRFRSNVNRTLYLVAIDDRFVPVGADGIREYKQIGFTDFPAPESRNRVDDTEI